MVWPAHLRVIDWDNVMKYNENKTCFIFWASTMNCLYAGCPDESWNKKEMIFRSEVSVCLGHLGIFCWFVLRIKTPPSTTSWPRQFNLHIYRPALLFRTRNHQDVIDLPILENKIFPTWNYRRMPCWLDEFKKNNREFDVIISWGFSRNKKNI